MSSNVRIGDYAIFRNIKNRLNLMAEGILSDDIFAGKSENIEDSWFQICLPRQYTAAMELEEFLISEEIDSETEMTASTKRHLDALERGYRNEQKLNEQYMINKFGSPVRYGDTIQLLHVKSKKYVTIVGKEVAQVEKENIRVTLDQAGSQESWLTIQPRFKINQSGDLLMTNAEIKLNVSQRSNEYLHCANAGLASNTGKEVNACLEPTSWLLGIYQSSLDMKDKNTILTSDLVYLSDPETKSVLSVFQRPTPIYPFGTDDDDRMSDDDSMMELSEEGEVVMESMSKVVRTSSLWMIQKKQTYSGGRIEWRNDQVRLRHVNTGMYLCMARGSLEDNDGAVEGFEPYSICVSNNPSRDKGTLLSVHELHATNNYLEDKRAVQLSHGHTYLERGGVREVGNVSHFTCKGSRSKASATYLFVHKYDADKVTSSLRTKNKTSAGSDLSELSAQPLDVFVGSAVRNCLKTYYNSYEDFSKFAVGEEDSDSEVSEETVKYIEKIWPGLPDEEDKKFYSMIDRVVYYLKGMPASADAPSIDDDNVEDDNAMNEFGEIMRNDALIMKRQNMLCDQGTIGVILGMLNDLLPIVKNPACAAHWDEVCGNKAPVSSNDTEANGDVIAERIDDDEETVKLKNLLHMAAKVSKCLLTLLLQSLKRHPSNQLYIAGHMHVVLGWVGIQPLAADVVRQMLSNNFELQSEHIGPSEIKIFADQICNGDTKLKSMYFAMLQAFCSCAGHGISRNQQFVMDALFPLLDLIFIKIIPSSSADAEAEKQFFASSLYLPKTDRSLEDQITAKVLGADVLKNGMPFLSLTWKANQREYQPNELFGKDVVALSQLFRGQKIGRELDAVVGSLENVSSKRKAPLVKRSRSGSFIDTGQRRRMMSINPTNSFQNISGNVAMRNFSVERKQVVLSYLIAQLDLISELCMDRNYMAISHMEALFPFEILLCVLSGHSLTASAKSSDRVPELIGAASRLVKNLYVDRESESTSRMPCMSILATTLADNQPQLACVEPSHRYRFSLLQHLLSEHVKNMPTDGKAWDSSSLHMAGLLKKLIQLQYYGTEDMLRDVIGPVMSALNRKNPDLDSRAFQWTMQKAKSMKSLRDMVPSWQKNTLKFLESMQELAMIMILVIVSTVVSVVQVVQGYNSMGFFLFDIVVLLIFAIEVSMRGYCHHHVRKNWSKFFNDHFVQLDIAVVLLDVIVMGSEDALGSFGSFSRTLRAMRLLRLVRVVRAARILKGIAKKELESAEKWALPERYRTAPIHELHTMVEMVDVLCEVQKILDDRNVRFLVKNFSEWSKHCTNEETVDCESAVEAFSVFCNATNELQVGGSEHDDTLLDLLMYVHSDLTQSILDLLMAYHSAITTAVRNATSIQILVSPHREKQFHLLRDLLLRLDRNIETFALWYEVKTPEHKTISENNIEILRILMENCRTSRKVLEFNETYEPDVEMQNLLRNLGCWDVTFKMLRKLDMSLDDNTMSSANRSTVAIMTAANQMLYWFVKGNYVNQEELFEEIEFFFGAVDRNVESHNVVTAIFANNETLMRKVPIHRIAEFAEKISKTGRFPQYLTLMSAITSVGDRNILENQYEIVKQISSPLRQKKILAFCVPTSHPDYARKLKLMAPYLHKNDVSPDEIAAELSYHIQLLRVLSGCTVGKYNITTIETKVQAMFHYADVIDAMLDKECLMIIRIETGLFLYNSLLEVEMLLPGLAYTPPIWKLLTNCNETLATAKDDLRNVERNGWDAPTVSRQKIEYIMVCVLVVKGFFGVYYDPVVFKREYMAISTQANQSNALELSLHDIERMVRSLFDQIEGMYEMDSPILSTDHKKLMWTALEALAKAREIVLTDYVQNIHSEGKKTDLELSLIKLSEHDRLENELSEQLKRFMDYLNQADTVKETLDGEFQSLIDKLDSIPRVADMTSTSTVRYEPLLKKLVDHFKGSTVTVNHGSGREKQMSPRCTKTAIWFVKMFRTMIENAWGMTIYERDDDGGEEQDEASATLVQTFNTCGATTLCLDLIAAGIDRELVLECIKFGVAMLFKEGGALVVQRTMFHYLSSTDSEFFFLQLRKTIQDLISWHEWNGVTYLEEGEEVNLPEEIITVRFMQLMCEGHFMPNQDIMREQEGKKVVVNLLDDLVAYIVVLSKMPCRTSTSAALAVGATILEVIQGPCEGNQDYFALNTSLIETLNHQMRAQVIGDCDEGDELELKKTGIDIFQGLLEGQGGKTVVYERVLSVIHLDVIQMLCSAPEKTKAKTENSSSLKPILDDEDGEENEEGGTSSDEEDIELVLRTESLVLLQMLCDFKPSLRDELDVMKGGADSLVGGSVACVEIMWRGELQRRFFNIPSICRDFPDSSKAHFVANVDRSSQEKKLLDMYTRARVIYTELLHHKFLREVNVSNIFSRQNQNRATWITFTLCLVINGIMIGYYDGGECLQDATLDDNPPVAVSCGKPYLKSTARRAVNILNTLQIIFSSFTLVLFLIVRAPVQYQTYRNKGLGMLRSVFFTAIDPFTLYYFVYVILAGLSTKVDHILTLLLLDIVMKNSYAMDVLVAIFTPIKQLAMACLLCIVVMYIFSMILFLYLNSSASLTYPDDCDTLWNCFKFAVSYGRSGDFNEDMSQRINDQWFFYFTFDILIRFVLLNVIRGITVDTFSELRLAKLARLTDQYETCFVCGMDKQVFDRDKSSQGFAVHIAKEHNMWNYLYFIIYIWEQDKDDDDGLEQYVRRSIDSNDISWLPTNKAMCLTAAEEDEGDKTKSSFQQDVSLLESNFNAKLTDFQDSIYTKISQIEGVLMMQNPGLEPSNIMMGNTPVAQDPAMEKNVQMMLQRCDSNQGSSGKRLVIELVEISGFTFSSRTLDSISCVVRSENGTVNVDASHVMHRENAPSLILFDPLQVIVDSNYDSEASKENIVSIQIARNGNTYVGALNVSGRELAAADGTNIQKSFEGRILSSMCRGFLTINVSIEVEEPVVDS